MPEKIYRNSLWLGAEGLKNQYGVMHVLYGDFIQEGKRIQITQGQAWQCLVHEPNSPQRAWEPYDATRVRTAYLPLRYAELEEIALAGGATFFGARITEEKRNTRAPGLSDKAKTIILEENELVQGQAFLAEIGVPEPDQEKIYRILCQRLGISLTSVSKTHVRVHE